MSLFGKIYFLFFLSILCAAMLQAQQPFLSLHPKNPHYFSFRNKPTVLIGSTEHYGAVMNLDLDYVKYLNQIAADGLNVTRTFSGIYVEPAGAFGIAKNTMAPANERYICPWARSNEPGYAKGGNKFDLLKWDENYFKRLKDFIKQAGKRNIIVELDLFSNFYDTLQWKLSPLFSSNNINGIGNSKDQKEILSLQHPELIQVQEKMVRKIVKELKGFDNLYYEICNEPYFGDSAALRKWEHYMTAIVADAEKTFANKHLISNNVANNQRLISKNRTGVSVYNFHYANPPATVTINYHLNKIIGDNETGFNGIEDVVYRNEAWNFILAGGGLFNHLDYSFTVGNEDGSFIISPGQPGGGGKILRNQFKILAKFINSVDFITMAPVENNKLKLQNPNTNSVYALGNSGNTFIMYFSTKDTVKNQSVIQLDLPAASYTLTWVNTKDATEIIRKIQHYKGGWATITTPDYVEDIALRLVKISK